MPGSAALVARPSRDVRPTPQPRRASPAPAGAFSATEALPAAENRVLRVPAARCAACLAPVTRRTPTARGPLPRCCPRCRSWLRDRQRLRGYLRSGPHLAEALGLDAVAARTSDAIARLDGLGYGKRP